MDTNLIAAEMTQTLNHAQAAQVAAQNALNAAQSHTQEVMDAIDAFLTAADEADEMDLPSPEHAMNAMGLVVDPLGMSWPVVKQLDGTHMELDEDHPANSSSDGDYLLTSSSDGEGEGEDTSSSSSDDEYLPTSSSDEGEDEDLESNAEEADASNAVVETAATAAPQQNINSVPASGDRMKHPIWCRNKHPPSQECKVFFPVKLRDAAPHLFRSSLSARPASVEGAAAESKRGIPRHDQYIRSTFLERDESLPASIRNLIRSNKARQKRGMMQGNEYYTCLAEAVTSYRPGATRLAKNRNPKVGTLKTLRPSQVITDDEGYVIDHELLARIELRGLDMAKAVIDEVRQDIHSWNYLVNYSGMFRGGQGGRNSCVTGPNGALIRAAKQLADEFPILARCTDNFKAILIIFWAGFGVYWTK